MLLHYYIHIFAVTQMTSIFFYMQPINFVTSVIRDCIFVDHSHPRVGVFLDCKQPLELSTPLVASLFVVRSEWSHRPCTKNLIWPFINKKIIVLLIYYLYFCFNSFGHVIPPLCSLLIVESMPLWGTGFGTQN